MMLKPKAYALEIITSDEQTHSKVLQTPAKTVHFPLSKDDKNLIQAMKAKLAELGGVGLAAPQANHHKQIIAVYIPEESASLRNNAKAYPMHILINPSYEGIESEGISADFEACYSVKNKAGKVPRYNQIKIHFYDEQGHQHLLTESGFYARVLQHEIDHINGILIINRLTPDCVQGTMDEMMTFRRNELSEEKKAIFDKLMQKKLKEK